jgi:hypothetical protein
MRGSFVTMFARPAPRLKFDFCGHSGEVETYITRQNHLTITEDTQVVYGTIRLDPRVPKSFKGGSKPLLGSRKQI